MSNGKTVSTGEEFQHFWDTPQNILLTGECVPFDFEVPALEEIVDAVRRDEHARITNFLPGFAHESDHEDFAKDFRNAPLAEAMKMPFHMRHFNLDRFYGKGQLLEGFVDGVLRPWQAFLARNGFTWYRLYPTFFMSGGGKKGSHYHMDVSYVLAWQLHGTKIFNGLKEPSRWAPIHKATTPDFRKQEQTRSTPPEGIGEDDVLSYRMGPGAVLWNKLLTPHWVETGDDSAACSLNISHGGVRHHGQLCPNGRYLEAYWQEHNQARF